MTRRTTRSTLRLLATLALLPGGSACAQEGPPAEPATQDRPLLIPQVEGERQGKLVGRAVACGTARARTDSALRSARDRMIARVGGPFTVDRYLPALDRALAFEASLGRPSDEACARALDAFEQFERTP